MKHIQSAKAWRIFQPVMTHMILHHPLSPLLLCHSSRGRPQGFASWLYARDVHNAQDRPFSPSPPGTAKGGRALAGRSRRLCLWNECSYQRRSYYVYQLVLEVSSSDKVSRNVILMVLLYARHQNFHPSSIRFIIFYTLFPSQRHLVKSGEFLQCSPCCFLNRLIPRVPSRASEWTAESICEEVEVNSRLKIVDVSSHPVFSSTYSFQGHHCQQGKY